MHAYISLLKYYAFFSQLLKLGTNCEDLSSIWSFICSSKYMVYIIFYSSFTGIFNTNSQNDQLPVGLLAQLVEPCTDPVQAWIFFQAFLSQLLKLRTNCQDLSYIVNFLLVDSWSSLNGPGVHCISLLLYVMFLRASWSGIFTWCICFETWLTLIEQCVIPIFSCTTNELFQQLVA